MDSNGLNKENFRDRFITCWLMLMSLYHLYSAGFGLLPTGIHRAIHLTFAIVAVYLIFPLNWRIAPRLSSKIDWVLAIMSGISVAYIAIFNDDIALRGALVQNYEMILGLVTLVFLIVAGIKTVGRFLPSLAIVFFLYAYFGRYAPGMFMHRGYSMARIIQQLYLTTEGVFGVALGVSSTFVFLFILFGSFLSEGGGVKFFNDLSMAVAGDSPGGPAKVAVMASALMGTINGSSVANVATTGSVTIPMMKKVGYDSDFAGAVEACSSTGGQLMPPIMGAGAFVMTQFLGISYLKIATAAIIPALLYYIAILSNVHFKARRDNLKGISKEQIPDIKKVLIKDGHLFIPIVVILIMLLERYTPLAAAFWGIISVVIVTSVRKHTRMGIPQILNALVEGARNSLSVAIACAVVGVIVGVSTLTALGMTVSTNVMDLSGGYVFPALLVAMTACLVMGMGLPTTANYIVTSTVIAPALMKMGILPLAAHLFVFYFGIMADITPPVCLASFTAAGIANGNPFRTGLKATTIAMVAYLLPYAFVFNTSLLMEDGFGRSIVPALAAVTGTIAIAAAIQGWGGHNLNWKERSMFLLLGPVTFFPESFLQIISSLSLVFLFFNCYTVKKVLSEDLSL